MNRSSSRELHILAAIVAAVCGGSTAFAQDGGKVMIDVADCIKLEAAEARLACYESRVAAVFGERAAQAAAARPAAPTPSPAASARSPDPAPAAPAARPAVASPAAVAPPAVASAAPPTATAVSAPAPAAAEPAKSRSDRQSRREEKEQGAAAAAANDIVSRVKELHEVIPNTWQVTLENGQVWRQTVAKRYELREGDEVRIYGTHWGSASRLTAERMNGYIQVERLH